MKSHRATVSLDRCCEFVSSFWATPSSDDIFQAAEDGECLADALAECLAQGCGYGRQHGIMPKALVSVGLGF